MKRHKDLDIEEDIELEHTNWKMQRVGWVLMTLLIIAALLGFFGKGGLAIVNNKTAGDSETGLEVEYEKFLRRGAPSELTVSLAGESASVKQIRFSKDFFDRVRVEQVIPEPAEVIMEDEGISYYFNLSGNNPQIKFYLKPMKMGNMHLLVQQQNKQVSLSQFVYP